MGCAGVCADFRLKVPFIRPAAGAGLGGVDVDFMGIEVRGCHTAQLSPTLSFAVWSDYATC